MSDDESSSSSSSDSEDNVPQPTKKTKAEPKGPKKPLSAYMFFCKATRATLKQENPESSFCDLGKMLGEKWKSMNAGDRTEFTASAEQDKVRYADEGGGSKKRKKKVGGPKRPLSAYMFFSKHTRPVIKVEHPSMGFADLGKEIGLRWKAQEDKTEFNAMAEEDKKRYRTEMAAAGGPNAKPPTAKKAKAKKTPPPPASDDDEGSGSDSQTSDSS